jgi:hypothetical protein
LNWRSGEIKSLKREIKSVSVCKIEKYLISDLSLKSKNRVERGSVYLGKPGYNVIWFICKTVYNDSEDLPNTASAALVWLYTVVWSMANV